jgi:hypothetical protein
MTLRQFEILHHESGNITVVYGLDDQGQLWRGGIVEEHGKFVVRWIAVEEQQ